MKDRYEIFYTYTVDGAIGIEANSEEEARKIFQNMVDNNEIDRCDETYNNDYEIYQVELC